ncbi:hypothetical protein ACU4GD_02805 [Cupriavidus basilensis]
MLDSRTAYAGAARWSRRRQGSAHGRCSPRQPLLGSPRDAGYGHRGQRLAAVSWVVVPQMRGPAGPGSAADAVVANAAEQPAVPGARRWPIGTGPRTVPK